MCAEQNEEISENSHPRTGFIILVVLWCVCFVLLIFSDIFGWIGLHKFMTYLMPFPAFLLTIVWKIEKPEFIAMIVDRINKPLADKWDKFFNDSFENDRVTPHLKELGNCIKETLQKSSYNRAYATREDMFEDRFKEGNLYTKNSKTIIFLSLEGKYPSSDEQIQNIMKELGEKNITIYVLNPLSDCARLLEKEFTRDGTKQDFIKDIIKNVHNLNNAVKKRVVQAKNGNEHLKDFKLYLYDFLLCMSGVIFEIDDNKSEYYITPYLLYESATNSPSFFVDKSNTIAYGKYSTIFDNLCKKSKKELMIANNKNADKWLKNANESLEKMRKAERKIDERK